jgi:putative peptidoglycan lipid II flippase
MGASGGGIARAATLVGVVTAGSMVLGLVRDMVVAAVFGAGAELDAFLVAQGLMNLVLGLLAGAVAKSAVPVLARDAATGETGRAGRTVSVALSVTVVALGLASVVMWLAADAVVTVLAPGFAGAQQTLAVDLTRVVLVATVLVAGTNLLAAAAQAHHRFFWAAFQGVPFNLVMIAAAAVWGPRYGVVALAWGFVLGSAARLVFQLVPLREIGLRLRPSLVLGDAGAREIAVLVPPLLLASAVTNVNTLVDRAVGSGQGEGVITALSYGWRVVGLFETLLVASLVTALYPAMGAAAGEGVDRLRDLVRRSLAAVLVVLVPVTAVLLVAAAPLVALLFGRGDFDPAAVDLTATAVVWYAPAVLALAWREVVVRASYAAGDTRGPLWAAIVAMVVNVVGDLTLGRIYGVAGLAVSTTLSLVVAAGLATRLLRRRHAGVAVRGMVPVLLRTGVAGAVATAAGWGVVVAVSAQLGPGAAQRSGPAALVLVGAAGAVAVAAFVGVLAGLRAPELWEGRRVLRRVLRRR